MLEKRRRDELSSIESFKLAPSRTVDRSVRKALFFLRYEGLFAVLSKVRSRLRSERIEESVVAARTEMGNAISFDRGETFYVLPGACGTDWVHPFSQAAYEPAEDVVTAAPPAERALFLIGCGDYARAQVLPHFSRGKRYCCVDYNQLALGIVEGEFTHRCNSHTQMKSSWAAARRPVALICSYHSDHARQARDLFEWNSSGTILVEKPAAVSREDYAIVNSLYEAGCSLEIGYNRRYAKFTKMAHNMLGGGPIVATLSVKEIGIHPSHWYFWPNQGGRICGNACHWIDLCQHLIKARPVEVNLLVARDSDDSSIAISYEDGSLATIVTSDRGSHARGVQEQIEIRQGDLTLTIEDFCRMRVVTGSGKQRLYRSMLRDKGHREMYRSFKRRLGNAEYASMYNQADFRLVANTYLTASEMMTQGRRTSGLELD